MFETHQIKTFSLYHGIDVSFFELSEDQAVFPYEAKESVIEICFCRYGRIGWKLGNKNTLYLGPGDYSIHLMAVDSDAATTLPLGYCEGVVFYIDLEKLSSQPPELLLGTGITGELLREKFCPDGTFSTFSCNEQAMAIFSGLFHVPEQLQSAYFKLRILELLLFLYQLPVDRECTLPQYQADQIDTIKKVHSYLMENLDKRITIEELSKRYLMNTTTLKKMFKRVYGTSIAAHIKEHRIEKAASLLSETDETVAQIARAVGYESQSKLSAAFKEAYGVLPTEYRKQKT